VLSPSKLGLRGNARIRAANSFVSVLARDFARPGLRLAPMRQRGKFWHDRPLMRPTVLIVDDHGAFRASATALLEAEGFAVVGEAADGGGAIAQAERLQPQIVLLDIQLPDLDGFAVAERLSGVPDPPRVVLISSRDASAYGSRLRAASALGFIAKRELSGQALAALVG
jgi:CheY-like chemotaxis protein